MRNTKIALAVLALVASTAAMADATVYGTIDTAITKQTNQTMQMNHSAWGTSVFGVKGSEDLDGGLKASFNLEAGIDSGTGTQFANGGPSTALFNRAANVGLAGEFGSVKLGNQLSPYIAAALGGTVTDNASYYVPLLALTSSIALTGYNYSLTTFQLTGQTATTGFFIPNAVSYTTPSIGGFSATALTQLAGVSSDTTKPNYEKYNAYSASFNAGDVSVSAGYERNGLMSLETGKQATAYTAGTTYTMGALKIGGGYMKQDFNNNVEVSAYHVGVAYSVSDQLVVNANYARADAGTVTTDNSTIINAGAKYSLSKRTYAYGTISRATNGALAMYNTTNTSATTDATGYAVGVGHNF